MTLTVCKIKLKQPIINSDARQIKQQVSEMELFIKLALLTVTVIGGFLLARVYCSSIIGDYQKSRRKSAVSKNKRPRLVGCL